MRVSVDANVLITGVVWPRWQHEILMYGVRDEFTLVLSRLIIAEAKHRIEATFPHFTDSLEFFLAAVEYEEAPIPSPEQIAQNQDLVRDHKDLPVALSIQAAHVDYFVTYDRDFTDEEESTEKVRKAIPGIILPPVFLRDVMGWTSEELEVVRHRTWKDLVKNP